jgi:hypothetical protein
VGRQLNLAGHAFDQSQDTVVSIGVHGAVVRCVLAYRHQVSHSASARARAEGGGEDIAVTEVGSRGIVLTDRTHSTPATMLHIKQAAEDGWAVEARPATPVNRPVAGD